MHILVIGATGPTGIAFVEEALASDHTLTLYVRNPSKLPDSISSHKNVRTIKGTFEDDAAIEEAVNCGATVLVSFAGPVMGAKSDQPVTKFYETKLFPTIRKQAGKGITRCLMTTTPSFRVAEDQFRVKWWFMIKMIEVLVSDAYKEVVGIGRAVSAVPVNEVEWTLFRLPLLTNGDAKPVRAGMIDGGAGILLSRKSIAVWILQELKERKWIGKAPALCNPGWI